MFVIQDKNRYVDSFRDVRNILIKIFILGQMILCETEEWI